MAGRKYKYLLVFYLCLASCKYEKKDITYYKNGQKEGVFIYKDDHRKGWYYYYDSTQNYLTYKVKIKNDSENGIYERYYPSGKINGKGYYKNGARDSIFTWYFENGNIKSIETLKKGKLNGKVTVYYPNGKIHYTCFYKDDTFEQHTIYTEYYPTGIIKEKDWCYNGKRLLMTRYSIYGKDSLYGVPE